MMLFLCDKLHKLPHEVRAISSEDFIDLVAYYSPANTIIGKGENADAILINWAKALEKQNGRSRRKIK